jgi:hypothetical protein
MVRVAELIGALALVALAGFAWWVAKGYPMGTARFMGPGYVPMALVIILGGVGVVLAVRSMRATGALEPFRLRPLLAVIGAIGAFALLIRTAGLMPATFVLACIASLAEPPLRPVATLIFALGLCALAWLIFIRGLQMPMRLFWF